MTVWILWHYDGEYDSMLGLFLSEVEAKISMTKQPYIYSYEMSIEEYEIKN